MKQTRPFLLIKGMDYLLPIIALYDAPADSVFDKLVETKKGIRACMFEYYEDWLSGKTLRLTADNYGCGGCGHWLFGLETRDREGFIRFLTDDEGLKASREIMGEWIDQSKPYLPENDAVFIGPYREDLYAYIKSVTFFVNPDQLSVLLLAANYFNRPGDLVPVKAPFGSGCSELLPLFDSFDLPQAIIGATDMAMRRHLPPDILAFTVNKPMYENFCRLDNQSFLSKPFLKGLKKAREGQI